MAMKWVIVTDANGVDFHALTPDSGEHLDVAWVYTDKESGFKDDVGMVNMKRNLKQRSDGKYGA